MDALAMRLDLPALRGYLGMARTDAANAPGASRERLLRARTPVPAPAREPARGGSLHPRSPESSPRSARDKRRNPCNEQSDFDAWQATGTKQSRTLFAPKDRLSVFGRVLSVCHWQPVELVRLCGFGLRESSSAAPCCRDSRARLKSRPPRDMQSRASLNAAASIAPNVAEALRRMRRDPCEPFPPHRPHYRRRISALPRIQAPPRIVPPPGVDWSWVG